MDDKSVVGVILRECAILDLHRLHADDFHLVIRQLEVLRLRIGTHVYSCLLCSCTQGRLFGVLLRCGDGVVLTHLIDARCLDRLCPGLSKRHAAEQGRGKCGSGYPSCYLQKGHFFLVFLSLCFILAQLQQWALGLKRNFTIFRHERLLFSSTRKRVDTVQGNSCLSCWCYVLSESENIYRNVTPYILSD